MYIYNITVNIDESIHEEWLFWMKSHILEVLNTGRFISAKFTEVLVKEDLGGKTYSVQYTANTQKDIANYQKHDENTIQRKGLSKFADKMLSFKTELRVINEFFPTSVSN